MTLPLVSGGTADRGGWRPARRRAVQLLVGPSAAPGAEDRRGSGIIAAVGTSLESWRQRARVLKREVYALYFAYRDPRVPWYAKVVAACVVGYALSPIDLIPDFVPVLGYVDDLLLLPLGVVLVLKLIPGDVMHDCRERAARQLDLPVNRVAAAVIVALWLAAAVVVGFVVVPRVW